MTRRNEQRNEADRRRPRDSMLLLGSIRACGDVARQQQQMRIRNLSATGLMADSQAEFDLGCCVELEVRGVGTILGEVVWIRDNRMGITFAEPINPLLARQPLSRGTQLGFPIVNGHIRRPGLRVR